MPAPVDELRELMAAHGLTNRCVAALAGVHVKTVESWLASPGAGHFRKMPTRHLALIRAMLPGLLAARAGGQG
jgi:hypothetical protein